MLEDKTIFNNEVAPDLILLESKATPYIADVPTRFSSA